MAAGIALLQGFYAVWAFVDPHALAAYRGGSIEGASEALWVHAYASRTLFIALVVALLLRRGDMAVLKWVALLGVIMPASDAWSAIHSAAPASDVIRHVATAIYLFLAFVMLARASTK
jgi:hypothetical protein